MLFTLYIRYSAINSNSYKSADKTTDIEQLEFKQKVDYCGLVFSLLARILASYHYSYLI